MITLIAEKPSVGMELARITGCRTRQDGYMEGGRLNGDACRVTWAIGHLCQLDEMDSDKALHWKAENLPVLPASFILTPRKGKDKKPDPGYVKQLKVIEKLFAETDIIVNCGDAGREGEVIQRWILDYVTQRNPRCNKPVKRLWISSMTDDAIRTGLRNLMPGADFDPLYHAGRARAEADWLVGINATEALTLKAHARDAAGKTKVFSLGRVQTPVLGLVCSRYLENKAFKPTSFWNVRLDTEAKGIPFHVTSDRRFDSYGAAESVTKRATASMIEVVESVHKPKTVKAPLLHDQTSLQQEASKRYDMSPDETLATVQKLYEMKLVTYPRTGSRFIPRDVLQTIPERLRTLTESQDPKISAAATLMSSLSVGQLGHNSVNDGKVTDHHALLVEKTALPQLSGKELKIYNLIAERMLEAFAAPCECDVHSIKLTCADETFTASATTIVKPGWKSVRGTAEPEEKDKDDKDDKEKDTNSRLPELNAGDLLPVKKAETIQGMTKPKPLYTYDSLLETMKTAGKESDDDEVKAALKNIGIGTAATRAAILDMLIKVRAYIKKEGKKLIPTEKGLEVYNIVKDMAICNVDLTGRWEIALSDIEDGKMDASEFDAKIRTFTRQITEQILHTEAGGGLGAAADAENIHCPLCGSTVKIWPTNASCTNKECGLYVYRTVCGKVLSPTILKHLIENGKTGIVKGFTSKAGKSFDARLKLSVIEKEGRKYGNTEFVFDDKKPNYNKKPWKK